ncbi:sporulation integral membrane protein YlbJ [Clostridium sp. 'White wine YQ']|uniref:sporulation integral membrane protein YlbJ n=1 Tax=Clostridium sp. 'White wine YQ' TaxID=3027474 RepID=UPI0023659074|nr:sporulation integral membrane protein YlbJ [Clostridium sp. 'White wine YQ']MDD7793756.1 sporulation integral membrane protein YlbJ [Clostridium sp. 'White wine YQ']
MYSIYILYGLIIILTTSLIIQIKGKITIMPTVLLSILIIYFLLNPKLCIDASLKGAELFVQAVLPTVLPFMVLCNLLIAYGGISVYSKLFGRFLCTPFKLSKNCSFPIIASIICGNPIGAKYSSELYEKGHVQFDEYVRLISIASNTGPLFLIGSVGSVMLQNKTYGYILLLGNYISMILIAFITRTKNISSYKKNDSKINITANFGTIFKNSLENAIMSTLNISGYIIIFSVIISIVSNSYFFNTSLNSIASLFGIPYEIMKGTVLGMIEITNGCKIISTSSLSINMKLCIISFLTSFCGFSVLAQISSFCSHHGVKLKKYFMYKLLQGSFATIITYVFLTISYF